MSKTNVMQELSIRVLKGYNQTKFDVFQYPTDNYTDYISGTRGLAVAFWNSRSVRKPQYNSKVSIAQLCGYGICTTAKKFDRFYSYMCTGRDLREGAKYIFLREGYKI